MMFGCIFQPDFFYTYALYFGSTWPEADKRRACFRCRSPPQNLILTVCKNNATEMRYNMKAKYDFSKFCLEDRKTYQEILESQPYNPVLQNLFERFNREQRNLKRWDERHLAAPAYDDNILYYVLTNQSAEETAISRERIIEIHIAIEKLPEVQRRRLWMYYFEEMTMEQIARVESVK